MQNRGIDGPRERKMQSTMVQTTTPALTDGNQAGLRLGFRPENVRTFADDLAAKVASQRAAAFINKPLVPYAK